MFERGADAAGIGGAMAAILLTGSHLSALAWAFSLYARTGNLPLHDWHPFVASPLTLARVAVWLVISVLVLANWRRCAVVAAAFATAGELVLLNLPSRPDGWTAAGQLELFLSSVVLVLLAIGLAGEVGFGAVNAVGRVCLVIAAIAVAMASGIPVLVGQGEQLVVESNTATAIDLGAKAVTLLSVAIAVWLARKKLANTPTTSPATATHPELIMP